VNTGRRWPLGSVTLENKHLWTREQLQKAGIILPPLDRVDPRLLPHVYDHLMIAAELVERGRIVIHEIRSEGPKLVIHGATVNSDPEDQKIFELQVKALKRDIERQPRT
jgi:hypothetical protein